MKTIKDTIHVWAQQEKSFGKCGNVFFENRTIYSYGYHYPMATYIDAPNGRIVAINSVGSSVTTEKHKSWVRCAIDGACIIDMPIRGGRVVGSLAIDDVAELLHDMYRAWMEGQLGKARRATKHGSYYMDRATDLRETYDQACRILGIESQDMPRVSMADARRIAEKAAQYQAELDRRERDRLTARREKDAAQYEAWRAGFGGGCPRSWAPDDGTQLLTLTYVGDKYVVETSDGARFPVDHARRAFSMLSKIKGDAKDISIRVGTYTITSIVDDVIFAGCHRVRRSEAAHLNEMILDLDCVV